VITKLKTIEMICDPALSANVSGNMPQMAATAVITIGRSRRRAACIMVWDAEAPSARYS
jgi:hypothetical protein